ncbi:MAG: hypothetical protein NT123_19125 [Proteobacteria bacterium]|nr:hypothetical protein [Pseudomonadota bacterium]
MDCYVHIDKKCNSDEYLEAASKVSEIRNIVNVKPSRDIFWGGFNMVEATLDLFKAAYEGGANDFILVSDDTIPIKNKTFILGALIELENLVNFVEIGPTHALWARYSGRYLLDEPLLNPRRHGGGITSWSISKSALSRINEIEMESAAPYPTFHYGSQWMKIDRCTYSRLLTFLSTERGQRILRWFKYSAIPDESFIHTILAKELNLKSYPQQLVYADFSGSVRPMIYDVEGIRALLPLPHLFARKLGTDIDIEALASIYKSNAAIT